MHQPNLVLHVSDGNVDLYENSDSAIINDAKWTIAWNSTGYVFRNNDSDSKTMQIGNASTSSSASVKATTYSETSANCRWTITAAEAIALYDISTGAALSNSIEYVAPDETRTLSQLGIRVEYFNGTTSSDQFTWTVGETSFASVNTNTGEITGIATGTDVVTVHARNLNNNSIFATYIINVTPVANGTYFLKNKQNGCYADIQGGMMADNIEIHQWTFYGGDSQKWIFNHIGDGYYTIRSANSTTNYYMTVKNNSSTVNSDIVLHSSSESDGAYWKIQIRTGGSVRIISKCGEANTYVLATNTSDSTNGIKLIQGAYVDNYSYRDEWVLELVDAYKITFYGISNSGHNHSSCLETVRVNLYDATFNNVTLKTGAISSSDCLSDLKNTNVFTSRSHGHLIVWYGTTTAASTGIVLNDEEGAGMVALYSHSWNSMTSGSTSIATIDSFAGLNMALFIGCQTAYDGTTGRNLTAIVSSQGAEVAIGFSENIDCSDANKWTKDFYSYLLEGHTVQESVDYASSNRSVASGLRSAVVCGNGNYKISE